MKTLSTYFPRLILLVSCVAAAGCNGPLAFIPGGALEGPEQVAASWEEAEAHENLELETRPQDPYSVRVNFVLREGALYIDPDPARGWYGHMVEDPAVRVRFEEIIYPARAVPVTDPDELEGFDPTRRILRLDPVE